MNDFDDPIPVVNEKELDELLKDLGIEEEPDLALSFALSDYELNKAKKHLSELLNSTSRASDKITKLNDFFLSTYPKVKIPEDVLDHPCLVALYGSKFWLIELLDGIENYWYTLFEAAREWFEDPLESKASQRFCFKLECEANTFWNGRPEYEDLMERFLRWRYKRD